MKNMNTDVNGSPELHCVNKHQGRPLDRDAMKAIPDHHKHGVVTKALGVQEGVRTHR